MISIEPGRSILADQSVWTICIFYTLQSRLILQIQQTLRKTDQALTD
jgi:hypothetical protein